MIHSVFVAYDGSPGARSALRLAALFAAPSRGKIYIGPWVEALPDPAAAISLSMGTMDLMAAPPSQPLIDDWMRQREEREIRARELFNECSFLLKGESIAVDSVPLDNLVEAEWLARLPLVDLVVLGRHGIDADGNHLGHTIETCLRGATQPVLVASSTGHTPDEIVALVGDCAGALPVLANAVRLAHEMGWPLSIATASGSIETGQDCFAAVGQYLKDHHLPPTVDLIPATQGKDAALIEYLKLHPTALLVMGAFGESRVHEWLTGSTTRTVLTQLDNSVILTRH